MKREVPRERTFKALSGFLLHKSEVMSSMLKQMQIILIKGIIAKEIPVNVAVAFSELIGPVRKEK